MAMNLDWTSAEKTARGFAGSWTAQTPGGAIIGFDEKGIRFQVEGGVESLSTGVLFTAQSVVRYASVTKHAFCTMVLAHPDMVGLEDRLGDHLPELQEPLASVTVGRALDMSGGLPDTRECLTLLGLSVYTDTTAKQLFDFLSRQTRLNFDAGAEVSYSNTGYRLVEAILERKGARFREFIRDGIGSNLGVEFDAPDVWHDPVKGLVPGYWHDGEKWQLSAAGLHISASGSMTGSAEALTRWIMELLKGKGQFNGLLKQLYLPRPLADGRKSGYGLGMRRSVLGERILTGHGGSHPGYKTYFLIDPVLKVGFVVVSNREDTNGYKIALESMAAFTGEPLPKPSTALPEGDYVTESGPWWMSVKGSTVTYLDADDTLYEDENGWVSSRSASSPMRLKADGAKIIGEAGHAVRRFLPARDDGVPASLCGAWVSTEGARFEIDGSDFVMGVGPVRQRMPLTSLGGGRFLFKLIDGPWSKRVCLHVMDENRVQLVLSRARMMEYTRAA